MRNRNPKPVLPPFLGESPAFRQLRERLRGIAGADVSVLVEGETGTGKEICARTIHYLSSRSRRPFLPLNCGAVPVELMENELFGHEAGAYTHALVKYDGAIRQADGGTLFLDEVDSLPPPAQVKFLRFLDDKVCRPLGASKSCRADVRVIAAAGRGLEQAVASSRFRADLLYRLNVVSLRLPPLRDRPGDIRLLAQHFVEQFTTGKGNRAFWLTESAFRKLEAYHWPGNVRQLENIIHRAVVAVSDGGPIDTDGIELPQWEPQGNLGPFHIEIAAKMAQFVREYLTRLLDRHGGNVSQAAAAAGIDRRSLHRLLSKHHIRRPLPAVLQSERTPGPPRHSQPHMETWSI